MRKIELRSSIYLIYLRSSSPIFSLGVATRYFCLHFVFFYLNDWHVTCLWKTFIFITRRKFILIPLLVLSSSIVPHFDRAFLFSILKFNYLLLLLQQQLSYFPFSVMIFYNTKNRVFLIARVRIEFESTSSQYLWCCQQKLSL